MEDAKYTPTFWVNKKREVAVVRLSDLKVQGWSTKGRDPKADYVHSHFQTTYPDKARCDEFLKDFIQATKEDFVAIQFDHHHLDDHFRRKADDWKQRNYELNHMNSKQIFNQ